MIDQQIKRRVWLVCFVLAVLFGGLLLFALSSRGEETTLATNAELIVKGWDFPKHTLVFTADGQIEIDGKAIEKMSDPEIKIAIKEIAAALKKQTENDELVKYYDRQTDYLLKELEKCKGEKP